MKLFFVNILLLTMACSTTAKMSTTSIRSAKQNVLPTGETDRVRVRGGAAVKTSAIRSVTAPVIQKPMVSLSRPSNTEGGLNTSLVAYFAVLYIGNSFLSQKWVYPLLGNGAMTNMAIRSLQLAAGAVSGLYLLLAPTETLSKPEIQASKAPPTKKKIAKALASTSSTKKWAMDSLAKYALTTTLALLIPQGSSHQVWTDLAHRIKPIVLSAPRSVFTTMALVSTLRLVQAKALSRRKKSAANLPNNGAHFGSYLAVLQDQLRDAIPARYPRLENFPKLLRIPIQLAMFAVGTGSLLAALAFYFLLYKPFCFLAWTLTMHSPKGLIGDKKFPSKSVVAVSGYLRLFWLTAKTNPLIRFLRAFWKYSFPIDLAFAAMMATHKMPSMSTSVAAWLRALSPAALPALKAAFCSRLFLGLFPLFLELEFILEYAPHKNQPTKFVDGLVEIFGPVIPFGDGLAFTKHDEVQQLIEDPNIQKGPEFFGWAGSSAFETFSEK